jgi:hypothetical protein
LTFKSTWIFLHKGTLCIYLLVLVFYKPYYDKPCFCAVLQPGQFPHPWNVLSTGFMENKEMNECNSKLPVFASRVVWIKNAVMFYDTVLTYALRLVIIFIDWQHVTRISICERPRHDTGWTSNILSNYCTSYTSYCAVFILFELCVTSFYVEIIWLLSVLWYILLEVFIFCAE